MVNDPVKEKKTQTKDCTVGAILTFSHPSQEFKEIDKRFSDIDEYRVRYSGILGQVYIEDQVNRIFSKRAKQLKFAENWFKNVAFRRKIDLLHMEGIIDDSQHRLLENISSVRNKCAHLTWVGPAPYEGKKLMEDENSLHKFRNDVIQIFDQLKRK